LGVDRWGAGVSGGSAVDRWGAGVSGSGVGSPDLLGSFGWVVRSRLLCLWAQGLGSLGCLQWGSSGACWVRLWFVYLGSSEFSTLAGCCLCVVQVLGGVLGVCWTVGVGLIGSSGLFRCGGILGTWVCQ
jgi:hypothetical protein